MKISSIHPAIPSPLFYSRPKYLYSIYTVQETLLSILQQNTYSLTEIERYSRNIYVHSETGRYRRNIYIHTETERYRRNIYIHSETERYRRKIYIHTETRDIGDRDTHVQRQRYIGEIYTCGDREI